MEKKIIPTDNGQGNQNAINAAGEELRKEAWW